MSHSLHGSYVSEKINKIRWKPDDFNNCHFFVTGSIDNEENFLKLWDFTTVVEDDIYPYQVASLASDGDITEIKFLDTDTFVFSSSSGSVYLIRVCQPYNDQIHLKTSTKWQNIHQFDNGESSPCTALAVYEKNDIVSVGEDGCINLLNSQSQRILRRIGDADSCSIHSVLFLKHNEILTSNLRGQMKVWDLRNSGEQPSNTFMLSGDQVTSTCLTCHPTQRHLLISGDDLGSSDEKSDPFATESDETYSAESEESTESEGNLLERKSKKCRKRIRNEKNWSVNKRKAARAKGVEYKTKKNKTARARSLKPPCSCRKKCYEKLTYEERLGLFNDFYTLSYQEQTQLLSTLVNEFTKLRCINNDEGSRRKFSRSYFLKKENVLIKVCKLMFLNTLDIGFKRIRYTMEKCRGGSGICTPDNRGRHGNHKRVSDEDRKIVMDHISKFPAYKSHYSRSHSNKRYLSPDLSIQQMYRLYTDHCKEIGRTPVSDHFYRNIFVTEFNISFHPPHNDTCGKCDKLEVLIKACSDEGDRINFEREKKAHLEAANDAYEEKRKDKDNSKKSELMITATFDLQKCLPTPHLKSGIAFYKRVWVFNLTVYEISSATENKSICFMWDETTSRRGGQEIASCLLKYIQNLPPTTTILNLYSDCCSGQNKNIFVTTLLSLVFDFLPPGALTTWDLRQNTYPINVLNAHHGAITEIQFHPDQPDHLFSCSSAGEIWHWSTKAKTVSSLIPDSDTNVWLTHDNVKNKLEVFTLMPTLGKAINTLDLNRNAVICGCDNEAIYLINGVTLC
nr:unnamed protein product [Callosobruchus analis]